MTIARMSAVLCIAAALAAAPAVAAEGVASADTTGLASLTPAELLVRASSSALQYSALIAPATRLLVADYELSIPYLVTRLDTDDVRERIAVEDILFRIGEPAVGPLVDALPGEALRTGTTRGARLACGILGRIADARAVDALVAIHEHDDWKLRAAVAGALGGIGDPKAARALVALLRDGNEIVRKSAAVSLMQIERKSPDAGLYRSAASALIAALGDPHYCVRYGAAGALAEMGEPVTPDLIALAKSGTGAPALLAMRALGDGGSKEASGALRGLLESPDWVVRAEAARTLGKLGPDGAARRSLRRLLESEEHPLVRACAQAALGAEG
jgi:HEAT repeat protein